MRAVISVSLPNEMAVRRYLWEERFGALRLRLGKRARTRGLITDEDVFNAVS